MSKVPDQTDVRTRGGQTTVKLTAAGLATLQRVQILCDELMSNPAVTGLIKASVTDLHLLACETVIAITGNGAEAKAVSERRSKRPELKAAS